MKKISATALLHPPLRRIKTSALSLALCVLGGMLAGGVRAAEATPSLPPIADFFRLPQSFGAALSPDGRHLALITSAPGKRTQLALIDMQDMAASKVLVGMEDSDIAALHWVNNKRIAFEVADVIETTGRPLSQGLWAIDRDGTNFKHLIDAQPTFHGFSSGRASRISHTAERLLPWTWRLLSTVNDGSDEVLIEQLNYDLQGELQSTTPARLDTRAGTRRSAVEDAPRHVRHWLFDAKGKPVAAVAIHENRFTQYLAGPEGKGWVRLAEGDRFNSEVPSFLAAGPNGELYLSGLPPEGGRDTEVLLRQDPKKPDAAAQVLLAIKGYDFRGDLVFDDKTGQLLGAHYESEARDSVWFEPAMKAVQTAVDAKLSSTINRLICTDCLGGRQVLVASSSDRQPLYYSLYDREAKTLKLLFASRPWIKAPEMAPRIPARIQARDGLSLPLMLTRPLEPAAAAAGAKPAPRPTVLLIHGGPYVRGLHWDWNAEAQFLASRGYLVIEPDFRGSEGYGTRHFRAGWKQWGLAMQDDIADTAQWAVQQGLADPQRICLAGASYGGYATMMGLIKNPELFKCGVNWVGVSDIKLMYTASRSDISQLSRRYYLPTLVGDPVRDSERLDQTSPLKQAARLKQPLLMAYGAEDWRVPIKHGEAMREALAPHNKQVEWVVYPEEGHGWRMLETHQDFWGRVDRFLQAQLKAPAAP